MGNICCPKKDIVVAPPQENPSNIEQNRASDTVP